MAARVIRFQPRLAYQAAAALAKDPDDLPQVFTLIESMSLDTISRLGDRFESTPEGRALLAERPDIVSRLADRDALARLPEGTVGRAYLDFVTRENISAQGIRDAALAGHEVSGAPLLPPPLDWISDRMRDTHDLWHVVTGFSGDVLGEVALLSFTFAQVMNPAVAVILGVAMWKLREVPGTRGLMRTWYERGKHAAWLPAVAWEALLDRPLDEVRRELGIEPTRYTEVRSSVLKAA